MSATDREALLSRWIQPSSSDEQIQQDRAVRMVTEAIRSCPPLVSANTIIYPKGSYPNNTNVRRDSDVDIVVECQDCFFFDYMPNVVQPTSGITAYNGPWGEPAHFRATVEAALVAHFGMSDVGVSGNIALTIPAVAGSRPSIDVVPSYDYFLYNDGRSTSSRRGSVVYPRLGAGRIVNWPDQQLTNGKAKNRASGGRYKSYVRALKNAENVMAAAGTITAQPSYLMECLVWNVPDEALRVGNLSEGFQETLAYLWAGLGDDGGHDGWTEPNDIKWLFKSGQKWTRTDARDLVSKTYRHLGY